MAIDARFDLLLARIKAIPIVDTLGIEIVSLDDGSCSASMPFNPVYNGIYESMHGGLLMTLADTIACFAILTRTPVDQVLTTIDMNIRFLAPCLSNVTAAARVIKLGRTICPVHVDLFDVSGKQVALAQVVYMRLEKMPSR